MIDATTREQVLAVLDLIWQEDLPLSPFTREAMVKLIRMLEAMDDGEKPTAATEARWCIEAGIQTARANKAERELAEARAKLERVRAAAEHVVAVQGLEDSVERLAAVLAEGEPDADME